MQTPHEQSGGVGPPRGHHSRCTRRRETAATTQEESRSPVLLPLPQTGGQEEPMWLALSHSETMHTSVTSSLINEGGIEDEEGTHSQVPARNPRQKLISSKRPRGKNLPWGETGDDSEDLDSSWVPSKVVGM